MTRTTTPHYDGRVVVPDEPIDLAGDTRLTVTIKTADSESTLDRLAAQARAADWLLVMPKSDANPPDEAFRRENLYEG